MSMLSHAEGRECCSSSRVNLLLRLVIATCFGAPDGGEQTDVNVRDRSMLFLAVMGSNLNMTRTPDCHFAAAAAQRDEDRSSPDFSQVSKYADEWIRQRGDARGGWR
jgi:hypothetical protein